MPSIPLDTGATGTPVSGYCWKVTSAESAGMPDHRPTFKIRFLPDGSGYVIDAEWPNGKAEQLSGLYVAERFARQWLIEKSEAWIKEHPHPDGAICHSPKGRLRAFPFR